MESFARRIIRPRCKVAWGEERKTKMYKNTKLWITALVAVSLTISAPASAKKSGKAGGKHEAANGHAVLWSAAREISARNLFYGPGGREHAPDPGGKFTFVAEDLKGTSPKFDVRDEQGIKWRIKLGEEARPETVATRLVWAVGYYTNEDYYLREVHVDGIPKLHRGQNLVSADGTVRAARLKRFNKGQKKIDAWRWDENPFVGTKELDGLRVMMALINNWDLKADNNGIYAVDGEERYTVSDLGASFGTTGRSLTRAKSKGNLPAYSKSKFIKKTAPDYVDFTVPSRPALLFLFTIREFVSRIKMEWIGRQIPRDHVEWIGQLLTQLSDQQIADSFRAAGYAPEQVNRYTKVVRDRISELSNL